MAPTEVTATHTGLKRDTTTIQRETLRVTQENRDSTLQYPWHSPLAKRESNMTKIGGRENTLQHPVISAHTKQNWQVNVVFLHNQS